jgi:hypothetical protein
VNYVTWLITGLLCVAPLLAYASGKGLNANRKIFGTGLVIAASFYVVFAVVDGNLPWLIVELVGVAAFSVFVWLATSRSINWLALGWFLHPVWDALLHVAGPGACVAPFWYAIACVSFDWAIALYLWVRFTGRKS